MQDSIRAYLELAERRPELFAPSEAIPIVMDEAAIRAFSEAKQKPMGLVYDNSPFYMVLADLCRGKRGEYSYARVVNCNPKSNGTVAIPCWNGKLGLLTVFRHAPRRSGLEFPRGFAETQTLTLEENIRKELSEEIGVPKDSCELTNLGEVQADSGLCAGTAAIYLAAFTTPEIGRLGTEEGIRDFRWFETEEMKAMIAEDKITDGFTISAFAKLLCREETKPGHKE